MFLQPEPRRTDQEQVATLPQAPLGAIISRFAGFIPPPTPPTTLEEEITRTEKLIAATARQLRSLWKSKHFRRPPRL